jgi:hypothetical protein
MRFEANSVSTASVLAASAAAWPSVLCSLIDLVASPYERELNAAWCGGGRAAFEVLGHCPACWAGSAMFLTAALAALCLQRGRAVS